MPSNTNNVANVNNTRDLQMEIDDDASSEASRDEQGRIKLLMPNSPRLAPPEKSERLRRAKKYVLELA